METAEQGTKKFKSETNSSPKDLHYTSKRLQLLVGEEDKMHHFPVICV